MIYFADGWDSWLLFRFISTLIDVIWDFSHFRVPAGILHVIFPPILLYFFSCPSILSCRFCLCTSFPPLLACLCSCCGELIWRIRPVAGLLLCQSNRQGSGPELSPNPFLHACLATEMAAPPPPSAIFHLAHPFFFQWLMSRHSVCSLWACLTLELHLVSQPLRESFSLFISVLSVFNCVLCLGFHSLVPGCSWNPSVLRFYYYNLVLCLIWRHFSVNPKHNLKCVKMVFAVNLCEFNSSSTPKQPSVKVVIAFFVCPENTFF